jgi:hypothetical protein
VYRQQCPVVMVAVFWILLPKQVMMSDMANAQLTILRRDDEEDEKLEDDNGEAIDGNSGNDC